MEEKKYPRVTKILSESGLIDLSYINEDILTRAGGFGTACHEACRLNDLNNLNEATLDPALKSYLDAWIKFSKDSLLENIEIEQKVSSERYQYRGTPDRISLFKGKITVIDIKTGQIYPSAAIQTAAYLEAYNESRPRTKRAKERLIIQLCEDGTYRLPNADFFNKSDFSVFLACLTITNYKKRKGIK